MAKKKDLLQKIETLEYQNQLLQKNLDAIQIIKSENEKILTENKQLKQEKINYEKEIIELKKSLNNDLKIGIQDYHDKGYQTLLGFKVIPPLLNKVLGRPFLITVAEEFPYERAVDINELNKVVEEFKETGSNYSDLRDVVKEGYSFRVTHSYSSRKYSLVTPQGKKDFHQLMFPDNLKSGLEINNQFGSAIYLALKNKSLQSAVLPENIFGAPLLSYAFPIFDDHGVLIGAISFSNDISKMVNITKNLNVILNSDSDQVLSRLSDILKEELYISKQSATQLKDEALSTQKLAKNIRERGKEVISISERLKVLALNTAIEATKVGESGKGVGIISTQMRQISEQTRKILNEIYENGKILVNSSQKVLETASNLEGISSNLQEESSVVFNTSSQLTNQKKELTKLVQMSLNELTQSAEDYKKIKTLFE